MPYNAERRMISFSSTGPFVPSPATFAEMMSRQMSRNCVPDSKGRYIHEGPEVQVQSGSFHREQHNLFLSRTHFSGPVLSIFLPP